MINQSIDEQLYEAVSNKYEQPRMILDER